jgi:ubiquinone/menaquinone biosynthesis C-methylase UbiE
MQAPGPEGTSDAPLAEQIDYYRTIASEYGAGRLDMAGGEELDAALESFNAMGEVLEIACGPGTWTPRLVQAADSLTALDASPEMLAIAAKRVHDERVRFVNANIFDWEPDGRYDAVFFGFWLSHVPMERFDEFWSIVGRCLAPGGRVLFFDDAHRTPEEEIEGEGSQMIQRRTQNGDAFRIVKVPHEPENLQRRIERLGWQIGIHGTSGPFFYGVGSRG